MNANEKRQGDVLLTPVASLPEGCTKVANTDPQKRVVLAYGEVTGHAHAIYAGTEGTQIWADGKVKYMEIKDDVYVIAGKNDIVEHAAEYELTGEVDEAGLAKVRLLIDTIFYPEGKKIQGVVMKHEEHTHHVLAPGFYKLPVQVEYTPKALLITRD